MAKCGSQSDDGLSAQIAAAVGWLADKRSVPREVAEDAVQEALLQLLESAAADRWPRSLGGWLRRTAERRLIDAERHRRTQLPTLFELSHVEQPIEPPDLDAILSLRSCLRTLDPQLQTLVVVRLVGASWPEVAAITGLGEDAARKRFERALIELRESIDGEGRP